MCWAAICQRASWGRLQTGCGATMGRLQRGCGAAAGRLWAGCGPAAGRLRGDCGPAAGLAPGTVNGELQSRLSITSRLVSFVTQSHCHTVDSSSQNPFGQLDMFKIKLNTQCLQVQPSNDWPTCCPQAKSLPGKTSDFNTGGIMGIEALTLLWCLFPGVPTDATSGCTAMGR